MIRTVGAVLLLILVLWGVAFWIIRTARNATPQGTAATIIHEYNETLAKAARASRKGHTGESNVYSEGAENLIELLKEKKE